MDAVEALINKVKNYNTSKFDEIKKIYKQKFFKMLEWYKNLCEHSLNFMLKDSEIGSIEERKEFVQKVDKLLNNK